MRKLYPPICKFQDTSSIWCAMIKDMMAEWNAYHLTTYILSHNLVVGPTN